ncbi:MAG: tail fiber assembly protein [Candidatus Symbiopectobacterium sp. Dall1.0]|nr:tail fiber assembly protein [Candidatus Symbiopectobacterium sp. Dall1.0]
MNNNVYVFSAKNLSFYPLVMKEDYVDAGSWPDDGVEVDEGVYSTFTQNIPSGKQRGADEKGYPCWVDIPPPPREHIIAIAAKRKSSMMAKAAQNIAPLQDAVDLDMATEAERAQLVAWKTYRVLLNRVDISTAPTIIWPEAPEGEKTGN